MKGVTRMFVWWPGMDLEIERMVELCVECQLCCVSPPPVASLQPWQWPTRHGQEESTWIMQANALGGCRCTLKMD